MCQKQLINLVQFIYKQCKLKQISNYTKDYICVCVYVYTHTHIAHIFSFTFSQIFYKSLVRHLN